MTKTNKSTLRDLDEPRRDRDPQNHKRQKDGDDADDRSRVLEGVGAFPLLRRSPILFGLLLALEDLFGRGAPGVVVASFRRLFVPGLFCREGEEEKGGQDGASGGLGRRRKGTRSRLNKRVR